MTNDKQKLTDKNQQFRSVFNVPRVVVVVLVALVATHVALSILGPVWQAWSIYALSFIPVRLGGGPTIPRPFGSEVWTFFSYALLHADKFHLMSNCLWLLVFSTPVAWRLGTSRYLILMAFSAAAGAATMLFTHWGEDVHVIGASASVAGAMAAAVPIMFTRGFGPHLKSQGDYDTLRPLGLNQLLKSPRALTFTSVFMTLQLFSGASQMLTSTAFLDERVIAWEAHVGGFVAGLLLFYLLDRRQGSTSLETMID